jgi:nicotinamidase-related amidase
MSVTALDSQTALIVVDLQRGIIGSQFIHPIAEVINRTRSLIEAFRRSELPVVLVNVAGGAPGERNNRDVTKHYPKDGPI